MSGGVVVYRDGDQVRQLDRHPLVVFLLGLCVLSGLHPQPIAGSIWLGLLWHVLLLTGGGLAALVGVFWRDPWTGVLIVRGAMIPIGFGAYAVAIIAAVTTGWLAALTLTAFGLAAHARAIQITRHLRARR